MCNAERTLTRVHATASLRYEISFQRAWQEPRRLYKNAIDHHTAFFSTVRDNIFIPRL